MHPRYLQPFVEADLARKMVFLGGPRQSGKTTLARTILGEAAGYYTWDLDEDRRDILAKRWDPRTSLLVFDELHKHRKWKNWLKGVFDTQRDEHRILVTGSARLDLYRRGGDSLLGRYHYWRLHPFTLSELPKGMSPEVALERLLTVGGFPEPFLDGDERQAKRWRRERFDRVLRDDIRDLEPIREIQTMALFVDALRSRVGSPVVLAHIAEDLQVAAKTLKHWLEVLERMYVVFVVRPLTRMIPRAIQKPPKVYFFDTGDVLGDEGARFENLVATHLLKRLHFLEDRDGDRYSLSYVRDKEGREVDFAVEKDRHLQALVEVKWSDREVARPLTYYAERLQPKVAQQIVCRLSRPYRQGRLEVLGGVDALQSLEPWDSSVQ
ncbi:MAG: ATP-binding protein [Polyangia bacterium]|jgi:predicted AAA+ superfamily ATPase|nr:ATP-binding protein [Polyangia bacterium]